jgi:16S rRNA (guanine527-N7)-methyltransferase
MLLRAMSETLRLPREGWQALLERAASALAGSLALGALWPAETARSAALERLRRLLELVVIWNQRVDLTAARSPEELVDLYLADALVLAASAGKSEQSWLDVGSGAGAPGLVLQLLQPELRLRLVEPRAKRVAFLRTAIGQLLSLAPEVVAGRSDSLPEGVCDVAVSRATFPPEEWLLEGARLSRAEVWVLLARGATPSCPGWALTQQVDYEWPLTRVARRALRYARTRP